MGTRISLSLLLLLFVADTVLADLVRSGGRGSYRNSAATEYYYVADSDINSLGLSDTFTALDYDSLQSGLWEAGAAPGDCYQVYDFDDPSFVNEPCYWQFSLGERLLAEGFTGVLLDAASIDVGWTLTGNGMSYSFAGTLNNSSTFLDVMMPADLVPGEYQLSMGITFNSGDGFSYFINNDIHTNFPDVCGELVPGDDTTFTCAYGYQQADSLSFGASDRLVILPQVVPEPITAGLVAVGLLFLRRRQRR